MKVDNDTGLELEFDSNESLVPKDSNDKEPLLGIDNGGPLVVGRVPEALNLKDGDVLKVNGNVEFGKRPLVDALHGGKHF